MLDSAGSRTATTGGRAAPVDEARTDGEAAPTPRDLAQVRDEALMAQAAAGDLDAFNEIVLTYQDFLFALVVRMLGDREAAADAVQEAFLNAFRNVRAYHGGAVRGWLARIALNAATDVLRRRKRRPAEPYPEWEDDAWQPPAGPGTDPEHEVTRRARGRALAAALLTITDDQRRAIILCDVEGFDYPEIATITAVSLGTVKSRIHRGRLALRERLRDQMELFRD